MNIIRVLDKEDNSTILEISVNDSYLDEAISLLHNAEDKWYEEEMPDDLMTYLYQTLDSHNIPYSHPEIHAMYMQARAIWLSISG